MARTTVSSPSSAQAGPRSRRVFSRRVAPYAPLALALVMQTGLVGRGAPTTTTGNATHQAAQGVTAQEVTGKGLAAPGVATPDVATAIASSWDKPIPQPTSFKAADGTCGSTGSDPGNQTNLRKNRTDVPASTHPVTFDAIAGLDFPKDQPRLRADWSPAALAALEPFEGAALTVTGYIVKRVKVEGKESTNCGSTQPTEVDWHIPLVRSAKDPEGTAVVVETTPRVRQSHPKWTPEALQPFANSTNPVRVSGWLMLDPEHKDMIGKFRSTLWEIHPITRIEVFSGGKWIDLDDLP